MSERRIACLILAAGKGTRMRSKISKVLHEVCGKPLLAWPLRAVEGLDPAAAVVVVPPDEPAVAGAVPDWAATAEQHQQRGTGDAALAARDALAGWDGDLLVLYGDSPLVDTGTLSELVEAHRVAGAAATVLTFDRTETIGADFGRIVRDADGAITAIVEVRDADPALRASLEVNSGYYVFDSALLWSALDRITDANDQGELYLTDVIGILVGDGHRVHGYLHDDPWVAKGVNTRADLAEAAAVVRARILHEHMLAGVTVVDPATTHVDADVRIEHDVVLEPFTMLRGTTSVAEGAVVGPHVVAVDAEIGPDAEVGPFCYLRPGTVLERGAKAGTHVEIKNTRLAEGAKVPHLSYIGDARIGSRSNIGAGSITANYDGFEKHPTVIGEDVRVGCDTIFIAPVTIGDAAYTAAGSTVTDDVPPEGLGVARAKQTNIEGYARRRRR